ITPDLLAAVPLFASLSDADRALIAEHAADVRLRPGEWLIQEGEQPAIFVVLEGALDVLKTLGRTEQAVNQLRPGDFHGEMPLLLGTTVVAALRAPEPSRVLRLEPADFFAMIVGRPALSQELLRTTARRTAGLQQLAAETPIPRVQLVGHRWDMECLNLRDFL